MHAIALTVDACPSAPVPGPAGRARSFAFAQPTKAQLTDKPQAQEQHGAAPSQDAAAAVHLSEQQHHQPHPHATLALPAQLATNLVQLSSQPWRWLIILQVALLLAPALACQALLTVHFSTVGVHALLPLPIVSLVCVALALLGLLALHLYVNRLQHGVSAFVQDHGIVSLSFSEAGGAWSVTVGQRGGGQAGAAYGWDRGLNAINPLRVHEPSFMRNVP